MRLVHPPGQAHRLSRARKSGVGIARGDKRMRRAGFALAAIIAAWPLPSVAAQPTATPMVPVVDVVQGVTVTDPYRWLEDSADPKVKAWTEAQNAKTRSYLDAL